MSTEVFDVPTEHLVGYGPELHEEVGYFGSYYDEELSMLFFTGGISETDLVSKKWSYFDLRGDNLTQFLIS